MSGNSRTMTTTTTTATTRTMIKKGKKKKKSSLSIKIKPFNKPPSLPPNFYETSTSILYNSLRDILHRQTNDISREELYNKVTDLCSHRFGPKLYLELVDILDDAALTCISRLVENDVAGTAADGSGGKIHYPTPHCRTDNISINNSTNTGVHGGVFFTSLQGIDTEVNNLGGDMMNSTTLSSSSSNRRRRSGGASVISEEDSLLLGNVWNVYSEYVQYLNCVRLIFQSLDRMFVYLPPTNNDQHVVEARVVPRNDGIVGSTTSAFSGNGQNTSNCSIASGTWNMWDVGMNCIYKHMSHIKDNNSSKVDSDSVMEDYISTAAMGGGSVVSNSITDNVRYSTLQVVKQRTIACLVEELKVSTPSPTSSVLTSTTATTYSKEMLHNSSVRNCVSIFRSFSNVAVHPSNSVRTHTKQQKVMDVMEDFLQGLISSMTSFLTKESQSYMLLEGASSTIDQLPMKTSYDTRAILHHIDSRLKQVNRMTAFYGISSGTSSSAATNYQTKSSSQGMSGSRTQNRILSHLVETYLLTPHYTTKFILHPANLHPILDEEDDGQLVDVKLLFQLSKRVHSTSNISNFEQENFNSVPFSPGMELLRISFEIYGKQRGLSIMRPIPQNASTGSGVGGGAVKLPPKKTSRQVENEIVSNLLMFKSHLEYLQKEAFGANEFFGKTLRKVLEDVLNQGGEVKSSSQHHDVMSTTDRRNKSLFRHSGDEYDGGKRVAELLAKYIDLRFKNAKISLVTSPIKSRRGNSIANRDDDMDSFQDAALDLFRHVQSKDVFEAFYRRDLAKRLLLNKSASIDTERMFVSKLKAECGTGYTSKMEGMFKDMELSHDVMGNYHSHLGSLEDVSSGAYSNVSSKSMNMDIQVLTTGYWPVQPQHPSLIIPETLEARKKHFESYYLSKYQGRRIAWQNTLGNCIVKAQFPKMSQPKELNVSLCQALVLMCFNVEAGSDEDPRLTINDIMRQTGLEDRGETERVLQSLSMGRDGTQVLKRVEEITISKDSNGASIAPKKKHRVTRKALSDTDVFMFNENFKSEKRCIRITNIQMKETTEERSKTQEAVTLDRLSLVDAAIVRIMKARKTLHHRSLVAEVMKQLKFPASGIDIKKRIETLIEREYLERVEGDSSSYNYMA